MARTGSEIAFFKRIFSSKDNSELENRISALEGQLAVVVLELSTTPDMCDKCFGAEYMCNKCEGTGVIQKKYRCDWPWDI